jgi:hypothetical protein
MAYSNITGALLSDPLVIKIVSFETKIRAHYTENLFLDIFYNEESNRYDFALIYHEERVLGWDNAPHHKQVSTHPHHKHEFGVLYESDLEGDITSDIRKVLAYIETFIEQNHMKNPL